MSLIFEHIVDHTTRCWCGPTKHDIEQFISMPMPFDNNTWLVQTIIQRSIIHYEEAMPRRRHGSDGKPRPRVVNPNIQPGKLQRMPSKA